MNTRLKFYKMTGSGNDFVFLDGSVTRPEDWPAERIRLVCDRRSGVGADGVVFLDSDGERGLRMTYFNADGSPADLCGNAALCSTRLGVHLKLVPAGPLALQTDAGLLEARCVGPGWMAELRLPEFELPVPVELPLGAGERRMARAIAGVPHLVVLVDDIGEVDAVGRGRGLRYDPAFGPEGINVNFVGRTSGGDTPWQMRTYERGVEGETLACGTGTVATAFALSAWGLDRLPVRILSSSGMTFSVSGNEGGPTREAWLCGEGRLVFEGILET